MNSRTFALVDCNNFYASCERVFNPKLENEPIVILSNNDGCIVSRSNEAKELKIPMGAPYFKYKELMNKNGVHVFSSNYPFYGDMSKRVMESLRTLLPNLEIYSIDEAFVDLSQYEESNLVVICEGIKEKVKQWTGIPISIGIGHTKTLAKVANLIAKKKKEDNICDLRKTAEIEEELAILDVEDIWGIASGWGLRLKSIGINTGYDLMKANPQYIRQKISVVGQRIVMELNGYPCIDTERVQKRKSIISSKSFGYKVTEIQEIKEAISTYAARACEKLRDQKSRVQVISVYLGTSNFEEEDNRYAKSKTKILNTPTSSTSKVINEANKIIEEIYLKGYRYQKTGITLLNLINEDYVQENLYEEIFSEGKEKIMAVVDQVNMQYGSNTVFYASQGTKKNWRVKSDNRSKKYTTSLKELPLIK